MRIHEAQPSQVTNADPEEAPSAPPAPATKRSPPAAWVERGATPNHPARSQQRLSDEQWRSLEAPLTRSLGDWAITEKDVQTVQENLTRMPPAAFRDALKRMDRGGLLDRFVDRLSSKQREHFLQLAQLRGVIRRDPPSASAGKFHPPAALRPFVNDRELPGAMQRAIHEHCVEEHQRYRAAYGAYLMRYQEAVASAASPASLRDIGHPSAPISGDPEPGVLADHPEYRAFTKDRLERTRGILSAKSAYEAAQERMNTLVETHTGGTLNPTAELGVKVKAGAWAREVKVQVEDRARFEDTLSYTGSIAGLEATGKLKTTEKGTRATVELKAEGKIDGHSVSVAQSGNSIKAVLGPAELELQGSKLGMSFQPVPSTFNSSRPASAGVEVKSKVTVDGATARLEASQSLAGKVKLGPVGLEVTGAVGFGYQGISREAVINAVSDEGVGIFTKPPELQEGTRWEQLSAVRRALYERVGWSAAEWQERLRSAVPVPVQP